VTEGGGPERLHAAAERLERIAAELDDPATADAAAVELAREAAQIAADAGATVAEAARAAAETGESA
jgi:hypothetical protein